MKSGSITLKLLTLVVVAFLVSAIGVIVVAQTQLKQIIDRSQNAMYEEKVEAICQALHRVDQRLRKTGLVEAYTADFQESIITELRGIYYGEGADPLIYPFIVDRQVSIIMHPKLEAGDISLQDGAFSRYLFCGEAGDFSTEYKDTQKWYEFKRFEPWDWVVAYAVPLDIKYHDVHIFITSLIKIMVAVTLVVLAFLSIVLTRFTRPIGRLIHSAAAIAGGNLSQEIVRGNRDEVGTLARSFNHMRDAIRQQITDLNREIDERRRAEKRLQHNEENLRTTLNSIGDAVIATDTSGTIVRMNPVAEQLVGWRFDEACGKPLKEVFHIINAQTRLPIENPMGRVLVSPNVGHVEAQTILISRDGTEYQISDSGAPIRSDTGEAVGGVLVFRDVTQEHALQAQLQQSQKMDAIGQLAGGIAHDFNNMLGGIMGAAELLKDFIPKDPQAVQLHELILSAAGRAADLTEKLLAFSRKKPSEFTRIDVHETLRDAAALLKSSMDRRILLGVNLKAEQCLVFGNATQLQNAFINLGINAAHAMPNGGTLSISTDIVDLDPVYCGASIFDLSPGRHLEVEIRDTGCGIDPEVLPRIFEPFYTTKAIGKGSGLGLSVAFGTIQQHHGSISVYSEPGQGSCFHLLLPLVKGEAAETVASLPVAPVCGEGHILVVDDEEVMRFTAQAILEHLGYEVTLAGDGREALALFKHNPGAFDLVILDMIMPEMNGRDCFDAMRAINPKVRVVLSSGFSRDEDIQQMQANGLCGYIRKPYRSAALGRMVYDIIHEQAGGVGGCLDSD
jgi:PAS domain S-box-containing protein